MKTSLRLATFVASLLFVGALALPVFAQGNTGTSVVVLDVGKVFKEHGRFKQSMEVMKGDVKKFEDYIKSKRTEVQRMAEELRTYKSGTPEYNNLEAQIAKKTSDLQVETQLKRKEFMQKEAKLYYNTYTEVTRAVSQFATQYGIQIVLRYNSEDIKPDDRQSVLAGVNANVVYHNKRDITAKIIEITNQGLGNPNVLGQRPPIPGGGLRK